MPLLIDEPRWPAHGRLWSHLVSDTSFVELHAFAEAVGLPARSFEGDHYDVPAERYEDVLAAGARPVSIRELVTALHASGLRRPKRKGERVLASTFLPDAGTAGGGTRRDLLASSLPAPVVPAHVGVLVFERVGRAGRPSLLLVHDGRTDDRWSLPGTPLAAADDLEQVAARAVVRQTDVRVEPSALAICGHARTVGRVEAWTTYLTTVTADDTTRRARWLPTDSAPAGVTGSPWWPLVGWLLDRRQPRTPH